MQMYRYMHVYVYVDRRRAGRDLGPQVGALLRRAAVADCRETMAILFKLASYKLSMNRRLYPSKQSAKVFGADARRQLAILTMARCR